MNIYLLILLFVVGISLWFFCKRTDNFKNEVLGSLRDFKAEGLQNVKEMKPYGSGFPEVQLCRPFCHFGSCKQNGEVPGLWYCNM